MVTFRMVPWYHTGTYLGTMVLFQVIIIIIIVVIIIIIIIINNK